MIDFEFDVILAFITTQLKWHEEGTMQLEPTTENGLKKTSIIRLNKLTTIDKDLIIGKLGNITQSEIKEVNQKLIELLKLKK